MVSFVCHLLLSYRNRWLTRLFLVSLGLVFAIGLFYVPSGSPSIRNAKIVEIVEKSDTLRVAINQEQARIGDEATLGQRVLTEQEAKAGLRLTGTAGIRLDRNSAFTVGSECIQLENGKTLVSGASGCIGSVIATNRGTIYVMERTGSEGAFRVLEGSIAISSRNTPDAEPVIVNQGQKVAVRVTGEVGVVAPISRSEFEGILSGDLFQGFQVQVPNQANLTTVLQQLPASPSAQTPAQPSAAGRGTGGGSQPTIAPVAQTVSQRSLNLQARAGLPLRNQSDQTGNSFSTGAPQSARRRFRRRNTEQGFDQTPPIRRRRNFPESSSSSPSPYVPPSRQRPPVQEPPYQPGGNEPEDQPPAEQPPYTEPPFVRQPPVRQPPFRQPPPFVQQPPRTPQTPTYEFDPDRLKDDLRQQRDRVREEIRRNVGQDEEPSRDQGDRPSYRLPTPRFDVDVTPPRRDPSPQRSGELQ